MDDGFERVIGLCDQSDGDLAALAQALGRGGARVHFECNGLNHASWYRGVSFDGEPFTGAPPDLPVPPWVDAEHELRFALSRELAAPHVGAWPNSYLPYYTHPERFVALMKRSGPRTDAILAALPGYYAHFEEEAARERP